MRLRIALLSAALAGLNACAVQMPTLFDDTPKVAAEATLSASSGSAATGVVRLETDGAEAIVVSGTVTGLTPNAEHGFHIHEFGDCSAPDAASAGMHFNPGGQAHGHHDSAQRHAGDMPNLKADASGRAEFEYRVEGISLGSGAANDALGRSVIVHRDADDFQSQPAGNAGPRIACGVIRRLAE